MRPEIAIRARRDLEDLHAYGISHYGVARADSYLAELFAQFRHISQWPYTARERPAIRSIIRLCRMRAHNIIYEIEADRVLILRVFHHSVNWIDLL